MYTVLGVKKSLSLFALLCAALIVAGAILHPPANPASVDAWWKLASGAVSLTLLAVTILGQTSIFPLLCQLPFIDKYFPPIDGEWTATLESNWPRIQQGWQEASSCPADLVSIQAKVTIIARLFHIRINLASADRYSTSKTIFVRASRDADDGSVMLHYMFRNVTKLPLASDSDCHDGAANLSVEGQGENLWLEGVYWTNRNWHKGLNTAGKITLRRG